MNWGSASEFLDMGGYAFYVWGSFGACLLLMVAEPILVRARRNLALTELKREIRARRENSDETPS